MEKYSNLADAIALAEFAHRNQFDKAGLPYIDHPKRVLANVQAMGAQPYVQMAAILHDVTEDTAFSIEMLKELGFSEAVVGLIELLDRSLAYSLDDYYAEIAANPNAKMIKMADIADNLSTWRLSYLSPETRERLQKKYAKALSAIGAPIPGW